MSTYLHIHRHHVCMGIYVDMYIDIDINLYMDIDIDIYLYIYIDNCIYIYIIDYIGMYVINLSSNSSERMSATFSTSRHEKLFASENIRHQTARGFKIPQKPIVITKKIQKHRKVSLHYVNWNLFS